MTQVTLKTIEGNKEVSETFEIKPMNVFQVMRLSKEINNLLSDIKGNEHLKNALNNYFEQSAENKEKNNAAIEKAQAEGRDVLAEQIYSTRDTISQVGGDFINDVLGSLEILLSDAPETLTELIATASNIDSNVVKSQDLYVFLDIFDAVVEVNDVNKLVERLKKSSTSLKKVGEALFPKAEDNKVETAKNQQ